jgi:uncharacterized OsmC-like protein
VLLAPALGIITEPVLKIILLSDDKIRLEPGPGPLTIEATSADQTYSPFHMLASSLATCTFSVLYSWATNAKLDVATLAVEVEWNFADQPHRVGDMRVTVHWHGLPPARVTAVQRAAELCTVHATHRHPPNVAIEVAR